MFFASAGLLRGFCGILVSVLSFVSLLSFATIWCAWRRGRWADAMDVGVHSGIDVGVSDLCGAAGVNVLGWGLMCSM